jgi:tetratricopeptide (TPR) repeat protein
VRKLLTPSVLVPSAIIATVVAMVVSANIREDRRSRRSSPVPALGTLAAGPTSREGLNRRVAQMEARLAARPDDVDAAIALADAWIRQSRVTGSAGLSAKAEQMLNQALRDGPGNYNALRVQGALYLSQHRFKEAVAAAERLKSLRPADPANYGILGDAHLELGDYPAAFDAFDTMMRMRPSAASYARVAYARELQGNLTGALESMKLAADASTGGDVEGMAWYHSQVGELYLRLDRPNDAMQAFATASQAFPGHPFAVSGYSRTLDAIGRHDEARALLEDLVSKSPTPDLHARLGDMYEVAGRKTDADRQYALAEAAWRTDAPEPKLFARFLADRGVKVDEAVTIAEAAVAVRQDIFTEDALAWAYFKAGRIDEARQAIKRALRTGTKDRDILRHARAIEAGPTRVAIGLGQ